MILTVAILLGGKALDVLGSERDILQWIAGILIASGAVAGALYHVVALLGAIPGIITYYLLMQDQVVGE